MQVSTVNFLVAAQNTLGFRFDAEYYQPRYLKHEVTLQQSRHVYLGDVAFITDGQHGYHEVDNQSLISHLTAKNAKHWFADNEGADKIAAWVDAKNRRSSLEVDDIILSTRGSVGFCALVDQTVLPANIDQDVARIQLLKGDVVPEYAVAYLNCAFGRDWIERNSSGMVQQGLSLSKVRQIPIPELSEEFQKQIQSIVQTARERIYGSESKLRLANDELLHYLGLIDWEPNQNIGFTANYSEIKRVNRIDAEYFKPKYKELNTRLMLFDTKPLGCIVDYKKGVEVGSASYEMEGIPFVRVSDVTEHGFDSVEKYISTNLYENLRHEHAPVKGEVLFTKDGTIGRAFAVQEDSAAILSGAFLKLAIKPDSAVRLDYLALVLNSLVCKMQIEQLSGGAIIAHLKPSDAMLMTIPIVEDDLQIEICSKIEESRQQRQKAKRMLETAKRAVEIAIEEDEEAAIEYIARSLD